MTMEEIKSYAVLNGVKITHHSDDSITVKYGMKKQSADIDVFMERLKRPARKIIKALNALGYNEPDTFVPHDPSYRRIKWSEYPKVKVILKFEKGGKK